METAYTIGFILGTIVGTVSCVSVGILLASVITYFMDNRGRGGD